MTDSLKMRMLALASVVVLIAVLAYPDIIGMLTDHKPRALDGRNIPPAFSGNRAAYGAALFSMFTMTSLSIRKMFAIAGEFSLKPWLEAPDIAYYRGAVFSFCAMVLIGVAPDVVLMMLWGEADVSTIVAWMTADRLGDAFAGVFFLVAITLVVRAEQLTRQPPASMFSVDTRFFEIVPRRETMNDHIRLVAMIGLIALGLALWK